MKKLLLILLACSPCFANGPKYNFKEPLLNDEFENVYKDISITRNRRGVTSNSNAVAGEIGEYIESVVGSGSVGTTTQFFDVTSISLTAGDWDVTGIVYYFDNGATVVDYSAGISLATGNSSTGLIGGSNFIGWTLSAGVTTNNAFPLTIPSYRISLASTNTVYLKGYTEYTVATPTRTGRISARRIR